MNNNDFLNDGPAPIRPEVLAAKLAAIRDFKYPATLRAITEQPRYVEMLWFIQAKSLAPGGLAKWTDEFITQFADYVGNRELLVEAGQNPKLTESQCLEQWYEIGRWANDSRHLDRDCRSDCCQEFSEIAWRAWERSQYWAVEHSCECLSDWQDAANRDPDEDQFVRELTALNLPFLKAVCVKFTRHTLPSFLADLCNQANAEFLTSWHFVRIYEALFAAMDHQAQQARNSIAETQITREVFNALDYAESSKAMVIIEGASRFGKTESVSAWCAMRPGRARIFAVPSSNSMGELYQRIAEALGVEDGLSSSTAKLKDKILFILRHAELFLIADEGQFLIPRNYGPNTAPARLDFMRTEFVDRHLPLAIVVTPQAYHKAMDKFVRKTGYAVEQFFGRGFAIKLPQELSEADVRAVAKHHFPGLEDDLLQMVVGRALSSEGYLKACEQITSYAHYLAARQNRHQIDLDDLEAAFAVIDSAADRNVKPGQARAGGLEKHPRSAYTPAMESAPRNAPASDLQAPCGADSEPHLAAGSRGDLAPDLSVRSFETSCPKRGEIEIPATVP